MPRLALLLLAITVSACSSPVVEPAPSPFTHAYDWVEHEGRIMVLGAVGEDGSTSALAPLTETGFGTIEPVGMGGAANLASHSAGILMQREDAVLLVTESGAQELWRAEESGRSLEGLAVDTDGRVWLRMRTDRPYPASALLDLAALDVDTGEIETVLRYDEPGAIESMRAASGGGLWVTAASGDVHAGIEPYDHRLYHFDGARLALVERLELEVRGELRVRGGEVFFLERVGYATRPRRVVEGALLDDSGRPLSGSVVLDEEGRAWNVASTPRRTQDCNLFAFRSSCVESTLGVRHDFTYYDGSGAVELAHHDTDETASWSEPWPIVNLIIPRSDGAWFVGNVLFRVDAPPS